MQPYAIIFTWGEQNEKLETSCSRGFSLIGVK